MLRIPAQSRRRRGALAIELLFALPILLAVLLAMVQFSMLISARQQVIAATREAARVAALGGGPADIRLTVDRFLGPGTAQITARIADANGGPLNPGEPVEVMVSLPTRALVPDMLGFIGFGLGDTRLVNRTIMPKE